LRKLPQVNARELTSALMRAGFEVHGGRSGHLGLRNSVTGRRTVIPQHAGTMDPHLVRTILKQAGISEDEFITLLA
jgi:predicted RNA binding protein YcfA (HicA-like mRNA interferase family)